MALVKYVGPGRPGASVYTGITADSYQYVAYNTSATVSSAVAAKLLQQPANWAAGDDATLALGPPDATVYIGDHLSGFDDDYVAYATRLQGDAYDRLQILADGRVKAGDGTAAPVLTSLGGGSTVSYDSPGAADSLGKAPLPADRAVHPNSATIMAAILHQVAHDGHADALNSVAPPVINVGIFGGVTWTIGEGEKPPTRKRIKVGNTGSAGYQLMRAIGNAGVPIPDDIVAQNDSDGSAYGYHKGVLHGPGWKGYLWSFFGFRRATPTEITEGYDFYCWELSRRPNADNWDGVMTDIYPAGFTVEQPQTDPYARPGTTLAQGYGQETGIATYGWMGTFAVGETPPGQNLLPTYADLKRGYAKSPIRMMLADMGPSTVGPARRDRGDGTVTGYPAVEGMLLTIDKSAAMPAGLTAPQEFCFRTAQEAGFLLTDKTNFCVTLSLASNCVPAFTVSSPIDGRDWSSTALAGFPWNLCRVMVPATPVDFHPKTITVAAAGFDFTSIANLDRLHLADDLMSVQGLTDGDRVPLWTERKNYKHLIQTVKAQQGIFRVNGTATGKAGVEFDGIRQFMYSAYETVLQPTTIIIVCKLDVTKIAAKSASFLFDTGVAGDPIRNVGYFGNSATIQMYADGFATTNKSVTGGRDILVFRFNGATSFVRVNGSQSTNVNPSTNGTKGFSLGANAGSSFTDAFIPGVVEKVAVYSRALTSGEITTIEAGLA